MTVIQQLRTVIFPALRDYWAAESRLTAAALGVDKAAAGAARLEALRLARSPCIELHHLSDYAFNEHDPALGQLTSIPEIRQRVQNHCFWLRDPNYPAQDVALIGDVADAFKHHKLNRPNARITGANAIITCGSGYGELRYGEGKFGGTDQVVVIDQNGEKRALTSILQNVSDAWMSLIGEPLPPKNKFG